MDKIVSCPSCNECCYESWLIKGPYLINGEYVKVCLSCDMEYYFNDCLPLKERCLSKNRNQLECNCHPNIDENGNVKSGFCNYCYKKLVPIGYNRTNGAKHGDWASRKYHKKCWKELNDET